MSADMIQPLQKKTVAAMPEDLPLSGKVFVLNLVSDIERAMCEDTRAALLKTLDNFAYLHGFKVNDTLAPFVILPMPKQTETVMPGMDPFCPFARARRARG